jgi:hypothetical protein
MEILIAEITSNSLDSCTINSSSSSATCVILSSSFEDIKGLASPMGFKVPLIG